MAQHEQFADPVVVPGPNIRSLFTDTEDVDENTTEVVDEGEGRFCPTCHRVLPPATFACPADGTAVIDLPPATAT